MIPRKRLDIGWTDLLFGLLACCVPGDRAAAARRLERLWSPEGLGLACLSVRSGFDALLAVLGLPRGSEVLVSAITLRDMTRVLEAHGLVPVPVDLDPRTLAVDAESLARAVSPRSRAVLVAHLFGCRLPLEPVAAVARAKGLLLIEDCAQAYAADDYRGHGESDVRLFSFGPIKTATALAGGLLTFRDRALRDRVANRQSAWPVQERGLFARRVLKYLALKLLSYRPFFSLFHGACRLTGRSHDAVLGASVRGFAGGDFFARIRQQPSAPLLALLARRLKKRDGVAIERRTTRALLAIGLLPPLARPGDQAPFHSYWVFPVEHERPDAIISALWDRGFDATRGASSLCVVEPPAGRPETEPARARRLFARLFYLPVHEGMRRRDFERLGRCLREAEARQG